MMRHILLLLAPLALSACGEVVPEAPSPQPKPVPAVPPVAPTPPPQATSDNWQDWPNSPGNWVYRTDSKGSLALFGREGVDADFVIRCTVSTKRIYISRAGAFPPGDTGRMTLRASSALKSYSVTNATDAPPYVAAELDPRDPQLDAVSFSRGRFIVSVKGASDLVIPAWPEFARVVEDCRS
jgi:hypothetical protein